MIGEKIQIPRRLGKSVKCTFQSIGFKESDFIYKCLMLCYKMLTIKILKEKMSCIAYTEW